VAKTNHELRDGVMAALIELQKAGIEKALLEKWSLGVDNEEAPKLLTD
jgi:hypothetical protein